MYSQNLHNILQELSILDQVFQIQFFYLISEQLKNGLLLECFLSNLVDLCVESHHDFVSDQVLHFK